MTDAMTHGTVGGMKTGRYLMGIDNGGTVTKAAVYDTAGREIAVASVVGPSR